MDLFMLSIDLLVRKNMLLDLLISSYNIFFFIYSLIFLNYVYIFIFIIKIYKNLYNNYLITRV